MTGQIASDGTRDRITRVAAKLFRERGYPGTTMRDLAKELGITSGSIFHHFGTKEDVLLSVVEQGIQHGVRSVVQAQSGSEDPRERLRAMVAAHLQSLLAGEPVSAIDLIHEQRSLSPTTIKKMIELRDEYEVLWDQAIGALGGRFHDAVQRRLVRLLLLGAMNWSEWWYRADGEFDIPTITDGIVNSFFPETVLRHDQARGQGTA